MFYRLRRKLSGRKTKRDILTLVIMIAIFVMSLGYGALSQYLEIEGMAIIDKRWKVEITSVTVASTNSGSGVYNFDEGGTVTSLTSTLPSLTSTVTYTITLKNSGNIEGKLYSIDKIEDKNTNITYTVSGVANETTTIAAGATVTATVTVQYKSGVTAVSSEPKKILLGFNFVDNTPEIPTYTVSVSSNNTSYGTVSPASQTVVSGSSATITLSPASGYVYESNTCGGTVSNNKLLISNVTINKTCTVTFAQTGTLLVDKILSDNTVYNDNVSSENVVNNEGIDFSIPSGNLRIYFNASTYYYFAPEYTYDSDSETYSLGHKSRFMWQSMSSFYTSYPYTCKSSSALGTCTTLYKITSYPSSNYGYGTICTKGICSDDNGQGLYVPTKNSNEGDRGYYFRGDDTLNNFVKFGKYSAGTTINGITYSTDQDMYWRIVRINGDNSVRMIYAGVNPSVTDDDIIGIDVFGQYGCSGSYYNESLKYAEGATSSNLKLVLEDWYENYLLDSYHTRIEDSEFCGDLDIYEGTGLEGETTVYMAYNRLEESVLTLPRFSCGDAGSGVVNPGSYTVAGTHLKYPIGTITADELIYGGNGIPNSDSPVTNYLSVNSSYWTMTPAYLFADVAVYSYNMELYNGIIEANAECDSLGIRPVINLKSTVTLSSINPSGCSEQIGSASCPYVVE